MIYSKQLFGIVCLQASFLFAQDAPDVLKPWTDFYTEHFTVLQSQSHNKNPDTGFVFEQKNIPVFNQLVFSWNALPPKGFLRYSVRIKYAGYGKNKHWSSWLAMAESGVDGHKTLYSKDRDGLLYNHVRLELAKNKLADGFQVKVESCGGAELTNNVILANAKLANAKLAVSCVNLNNFRPEKLVDQYDGLASVWVQNVPMRSQMFLRHPRAEKLCSPTSLSMLVEYLGNTLDTKQGSTTRRDPVAFAMGVYDKGLEVYGSWPCNAAHAFNVLDGRINFYVDRLHSFKDLYDILALGTPVVASICGVLEGAPKTNFDGHLILIVGYDAQTRTVLCHDPAVGYGLRVSAGAHLNKIPEPKNVLMCYPLENFLRVWEARNRLVYRAQKKQLNK